MEKLKHSLDISKNALQTLLDILKESETTIIRDASIQRFEYTFETIWKLIKVYLYEIEGIDCNSPKSCIRSALKTGLVSIDQAEVALAMCDDRNLTSQTYIENISKIIYSRLLTYAELMSHIVNKIGNEFN